MRKYKRYLLDTNVLCAAILTSGLQYEILKMGQAKFYDPVVTEVVIFEFISKCRNGMGRKKFMFTEDEIDEFIDSLSPMLDLESRKRVSIGREFSLDPVHYQKPIYYVLADLTKRNREELKETVFLKDNQVYPGNLDLRDLHVMVGAIEHDCDYIVTKNIKDFPAQIGNIQIVQPESAYANIREALR